MPSRFTFEKLKVATNKFSDKLGEGGFGSVFKGQLGEETVAIKQLDRAGQGKKEFFAEVQIIGCVQHINLVKLVGFFMRIVGRGLLIWTSNHRTSS